MGDTLELAIPKRALFKAAEVCEIAQLQPYVLRSWEAEFPELGLARSSGAPRVYRRADVERVLQIKQLVFGEGLTLAGARKRLAMEPPASATADSPPIDELFGQDARERIAAVRDGLRGILQLLSGAEVRAAVPPFELKPSAVPRTRRPEPLAKAPRPVPATKSAAKRKRAHA